MADDDIDSTVNFHVLHDAHDNAWVVDLKYPCDNDDCTRDHVNVHPADFHVHLIGATIEHVGGYDCTTASNSPCLDDILASAHARAASHRQ